jgi:hypothetical protein
MSYLNRRARAMGRPVTLADRGRRLRTPVVRSYGPWSLGDSTADACSAQAHAQEDQFQAALNQMMASWGNNTGLYAMGDVQPVMQTTYQFIAKAQQLLDTHRATYGDTGPDFVVQALDQAQSNLFTDARTGLEFQQEWAAAQSAGATVFNAPGMKQWVADAMIDAGRAAFAATYTTCTAPSGAATIIAILRDLITFGNAILSAIEKAVTIAANMVITGAEIVYKTTVGTLGMVAAVVHYLPWIAGGVGAWWLWQKYGKDVVGKK